MFIDKIKIWIKAGNGGSGHVSFMHDKMNMYGGPDGGDGGNGGDVIFEVDNNQSNLVDFYYKKNYEADDGERGGKQNSYGKSGKDCIIKVPKGTILRNPQTNAVICDMFELGQREVVLKGGRGGKGNAQFATSRKQTPNFSQSGVQTKKHELLLELKTIADVGLIGFPNVGKSTLLSSVTNARPKIANYHFTTLSPNLGVVKYYDNNFVVADIPGLIEGASQGDGLGHEFLRHIERTRLLVHVIDISGFEGRDPVQDFVTINNELSAFSPALSQLPQIIALNKCDLLYEDKSNIKAFEKAYGKKYKILQISAATTTGLQELLKEVFDNLKELPQIEPLLTEDYDFGVLDKTSLKIVRNDKGEFICSGGMIESISRGVVLSDTESFGYFQRKIVELGIDQKLRDMGVKEGDIVIMGDIEFEYIE